MKSKKLKWCVLLTAGMIYYVLIRYTSFGIPCLFYKILHLKCPGCGITHMIFELSLFHWREAMEANYFLFWTAPVLVGLCTYEFILKPEKKGKESVIFKTVEIVYLILFLIWMVIRNLLHV